MAADESLGRARQVRIPVGRFMLINDMKLCVLSFSDRRQLEQAAQARIGKAFRPGTQANHRSHVLLYTAFTAHFDLPDFPATPLSLVLFGEFLLRSFRAPMSVTNALASIKGFHLDGGLTTAAFASRRLVLLLTSRG